MRYLLGIDLGCTGLKTILFDEEGNPMAYAHEELSSDAPAPGYVEQDANGWWEVACANIRRVINDSNVDPKNILGVGVTGEGPSLVCVDENGSVLRPAMIHRDTRASIYVKRFTGIVEKMSRLMGLPVDPSFLSEFPALRLLWIRENEPDVFEKIQGCMMSWDFIKYRLTGEITRLADLDRFTVIPSRLFNMPRRWFGKAYKSPTDVVGQVTDEAAEKTGLEKGTPVVLGTFDNPCNSLGAGLTEEGIAVDQAGATEIINVAVSKRPRGFAMRPIIPGLWIVGTSPFRGVILRWFIDQFAFLEAEKVGVNPYQFLDLEAERVKAGSDGLVFLPYLTGETSAFHDPNARGVFLGISLSHGKEHFARAIFEGIAFSLRQILENYQSFGVELKEVRLGGGGAKSRVWNQIKADVLGRPLSVLHVLETGCLGAALLASVGVGLYSSIREASESLVKVSERVKPKDENHEKYDGLYSVYREAYSQLKGVFAELARV